MSGDEHTRPEPVTQPLAPSPAAGAYAAGARVGRYRLLRKLGDHSIEFKDLRTSESSLEDIFVRLVTSDRRDAGPAAGDAELAGEAA